ncbi:MAG: hypothetical protein ABFS12_02840 [Bacteroidota bacterium]
MNKVSLLLFFLLAVTTIGCAQESETKVVNPYSKWDGFVLESNPYYFPIGVYTQRPEYAGKYKELGINLYYYLWQGPTAEQITDLKKYGMRTICEFNEYAKENLINDPVVVAWTHLDEPDLVKFSRNKLTKMGQTETKALVKKMWPKMYDKMELGTKDYKGWGFGYSPEYCREEYEKIKKYDSSRPVILGLSKGVVIKEFNARGDRKYNNEDYQNYVNGSGDILSFDIYPVAYKIPEQLNKVADGVDSLAKWDSKDRLKFVAIECTFGRPDGPSATSEQIRAEIWMAIIRGARGISYFVHNFDGDKKFVRSDGLLADPEMMNAIKKQNAEIHSLAKVIYADETSNVKINGNESKIDFVAKEVDGYLYVLSSTITTEEVEAEFNLDNISNGTIEVINEKRTVELKNGKFTDQFAGYDVNLYKIKL